MKSIKKLTGRISNNEILRLVYCHANALQSTQSTLPQCSHIARHFQSTKSKHFLYWCLATLSLSGVEANDTRSSRLHVKSWLLLSRSLMVCQLQYDPWEYDFSSIYLPLPHYNKQHQSTFLKLRQWFLYPLKTVQNGYRIADSVTANKKSKKTPTDWSGLECSPNPWLSLTSPDRRNHV